jgi:hypothetical protein
MAHLSWKARRGQPLAGSIYGGLYRVPGLAVDPARGTILVESWIDREQ